jgi:hypothetical protein
MHAISLLRTFLWTSELGQNGNNAKKDERSSGGAGGWGGVKRLQWHTCAKRGPSYW